MILKVLGWIGLVLSGLVLLATAPFIYLAISQGSWVYALLAIAAPIAAAVLLGFTSVIGLLIAASGLDD